MVAIMPVSDPLSSLRYWLITVEGNRRSMVYNLFILCILSPQDISHHEGPRMRLCKLTNYYESFRFHASMLIYVLGCYMTNFIKTLGLLPYMTYNLV